MKDTTLKFTAEVAEALRARVKALVIPEIAELKYQDIVDGVDEKARKIKEDNGTFDVIVSTEMVDRAGEVVKQDGWDLSNYKNNPVVLFGHDYYSLGIGVCLETYNTTYRGVPALGARGVFYSADINPLAQQIRKMYDFGVKMGVGAGCTTSVGFIPKDFDSNNHSIITRSELLEFSFVPVPANQGVGPAQGRALTIAEAQQLGIDTFALKVKGLEFLEKAAKESQAGDRCETDDGQPGVLGSDPKDPDGPMICIPQEEDKGAKGEEEDPAADDGAHKLTKAVTKEFSRHTKAIAGHFKAFKGKAADAMAADKPEEGSSDEGEKAAHRAKAASAIGKCTKELKSALSDEHDMHRSHNIAAFRAYEPAEAEQKDFNKEDHIKALKDEHSDYETKCGGSFSEFEDKMKELAGASNDDNDAMGNECTDWITKEFGHHGENHMGNVAKCAKAMCAGFGEGEESEEKIAEAIVAISTELAAPVSAEHAAAIAAEIVAMRGMTVVEVKVEHGASGETDFEKFVKSRDLARLLAGSLNDFLSESRKGIRIYHRGGKS